MMKIEWRDALRHLLQVLAFCSVVAVFTTMIWAGSGYPHQLVYSLCIGLTTWGVIEFGRYLVDPRHCHRAAGAASQGWPKGWRGVALTLAGIVSGYFGGSSAARLLLGEEMMHPQRDLPLGLLVTVAAGVVASFYFHARGRAAALQAEIAAAQRDASEARLKLLETQLEPHMLFNTLANLRALITIDPPRALVMLDHLDRYLRVTLAGSRALSHPLAAEFARLADYLALMAIRMGPRLAYRLALPEALRDLPVPPLLLQPLVENAIRHGLEPRVAGGRIDISAALQDDGLRLEVADTGVGFDPQGAPRADCFGLAQVRERVVSAHGGRGRVEVRSNPGQGTTVRVTLPLDTIPPP